MGARNGDWIFYVEDRHFWQECQTLFSSFWLHRTASLPCELRRREWRPSCSNYRYASRDIKRHGDSYFRYQPFSGPEYHRDAVKEFWRLSNEIASAILRIFLR